MSDVIPPRCCQVTKLVYEVSEEDVIRARNQIKSSMLFSVDGSGGMSSSTSPHTELHLLCSLHK